MAPKPGRRDEVFTPETRELVEKYYKLATHITWTFWKSLPPGSKDPDDLLSVGTWALIDSALRWNFYCEENSYDPKANYFHAFLMQKVKGALLDYCRSEDYVTREIRDLAKDIGKLTLENRSRSEIISMLNISDAKYSSVLAAIANFPWNCDGLAEDTLIGDTESVVDANYLLKAFVEIIESFDEITQIVLALKYYSDFDLPKIAVVLDKPVTAIQKIHTTAVMELKERMEAKVHNIGTYQPPSFRYMGFVG